MARKMKNSGIEWAGAIPVDWNRIIFWQAIERLGTGLNPRENFELTKDDDLFYVTIRNYDNGKLFLDDNCDRISREAWEIIQERSQLAKGDILFASISEEGKVYLIEEEPSNWNINESVFCIRFKEEIFDKKFIQYHLRESSYYEDLRMDATGTTFKSIKQNKLRSSRMLVPPIVEQQKIASYLDAKVAKIDEAISKTRSTIEEYKALKQSVITKAVTKGIRGDRPMKDSGIEWIGEIPEEWEIMKTKNIGNTQNGISKGAECFGQGYPFVSYGDIYRNYEIPEAVKGLIDSTEEERKKYSVRKGDIFFTRTSETIEEVGFSSVCKKDIMDATFAGFAIRLRPYKTDEFILTDFAKYYYRSSLTRTYLVKEMNLVTRASMSQGLLGAMYVVVPLKAEQQEIADYLDSKCSAIDEIISKKEQLITELESYKKSLIYEYVTGKKEVPEQGN